MRLIWFVLVPSTKPNDCIFSPHHAINKDNHTLKDNVDVSDLNDSKVLKSILEALKLKKNKKGQKDHPHFKRNSTIAKNETGNFNIYSPGKVPELHHGFAVGSNSVHLRRRIEFARNRLPTLQPAAKLGGKGPKIPERTEQKV